MSTEDEIARRLLQGFTPAQLIEEGFKKSTVYKVNQEIKAHSVQTAKHEWEITNIYPPELRGLPKENKSVSFQFENISDKDMYLYRIGIFTEWMEQNTWIAQEVKDLVKPGQKRFFSFLLSIPNGLALDEYTLTFGVELQYLPTSGNQYLQTQWTEPIVFHVKEPRKNVSLFLSHSTKDMTLVHQLEKLLDNHGITVLIGEDMERPGTDLKQKFEGLIQGCTIFVALLTEEGANSQWVITETEFARQINKPMILLKEQNANVQMDREWTSFSKYDPPDVILKKIMDAINKIQTFATGIPPEAAIVGVGILAFILGLALGSGEK